MSKDNKDLLISLGVKLVQMVLEGAGAAAIFAWNKHVQAVVEAEETGVPLSSDAQRAISAAIRATGDDLLAIDTGLLRNPPLYEDLTKPN